jgi:FAD-dependent urate hydroxylase
MAHVLIVGGGICGPVTAMALQRAGIDATVFEAYDTPSHDAGSYLTIATNGLDGLRAIDLERPVLATAFPTPDAALFSGSGRHLATVSLGRKSDGTVSHTIKRAHLHRALHDEAKRRGVHIEFGKRLAGVDVTAGGVIARFADGSDTFGDLLIGCDGVHSVTRRLIDPSAPAPRYAGLLNFGGYTPGISATPAGHPSAGAALRAPTGTWHMIFGQRAFFGYVADTSGGTVWFANTPRHAATHEERDATTHAEWKRYLLELFSNDRGPAGELIAAGRLELAADNTHDLPSVPKWHRGPLIVIGDAAHAPTPTSGQGASLAIEDGVVLAKCLKDTTDAAKAFSAFETLRRRRVERIVAEAARMSSQKAAGPVGRALRDLLLPVVIKLFVTPRSQGWIHDYHIAWQE